ncbi:hypothetical protein A7K50_03385 [Dehalobacter sp. MCB1]|uniref:hypothetical protein n=1 Tax=Dehalobacter sp. MCB1 TaxID=1844756 RepID=UPI000E6D3EF0|nr:hypothetical protein [Dehalobacter sp. MCB1]RJE47704.1 hypothetical protein A7K50_03385 [Dehalobacter sp. MCB1]
MSGWDFNTSGSSTSTKAEFTKFPQGVTNIRIVDSEPFIRWTHWMPQHKRSINCPGKGCPICEIRKQQKANQEPYTQNMARRIAINVLNRETGKVEIMEQGVGFFEDIRDLMDDLSDDGKTLIDCDIKVKRRGTGKDDTSYRLDLGSDTPLTDVEKKLIEEGRVNLNDFFKPHTNEQIMRILNGEEWNEVMKSNQEEKDNDEEVVIQ